MARSRYVNINEVTKGGHTYFRARLYPPFDPELGKPKPIDFYGKTKAEADAKRAAYKPEDKKLDKETYFTDVVSELMTPTSIEPGSIAGMAAVR